MRLITNLSFAQVNYNGQPLRIYCRALLLDATEALFSGEPLMHRIRGFGPDSSLEIFTLWLKCGHLEYEMTEAENNQVVFIGDSHPEGRPLFRGATVKFKDGVELFLQAEDPEQPLDVVDFTEYLIAWEALDKKVRRYYRSPNFPVVSYVPTALV